MDYDPMDAQSSAYYAGTLIPELGKAPVHTEPILANSGHARNYDPAVRDHASREVAAVAAWIANEDSVYTSVNTSAAGLNDSTKSYYKRIIEEERAKRIQRPTDIAQAKSDARIESGYATDYYRRKSGDAPPSPVYHEPCNMCRGTGCPTCQRRGYFSYHLCSCCFGSGSGWDTGHVDPRFPREVITRYKQITCECCGGSPKLYFRGGGKKKQKSRRKTRRRSKRLL